MRVSGIELCNPASLKKETVVAYHACSCRRVYETKEEFEKLPSIGEQRSKEGTTEYVLTLRTCHCKSTVGVEEVVPPKKVIYTGIFLTPESKAKLLRAIPPNLPEKNVIKTTRRDREQVSKLLLLLLLTLGCVGVAHYYLGAIWDVAVIAVLLAYSVLKRSRAPANRGSFKP